MLDDSWIEKLYASRTYKELTVHTTPAGQAGQTDTTPVEAKGEAGVPTPGTHGEW